LTLTLTLAACAASGPLVVPADLPLTAYDQGFTLRWILEHSSAEARAAGTIAISGFRAKEINLVLYGLDAQDRIVSRGYGLVRQVVDLTPQPFEVRLRLAGSEARFDLRVSRYKLGGTPGPPALVEATHVPA
jgi:hypothetical protein